MSQKVIHGYAWYTYPDVFGLDGQDATDPGHPFAFAPGEVHPPAEVVFFRPVFPADAGDPGTSCRDHSYLVPDQDTAPSHDVQGVGVRSSRLERQIPDRGR